MGVPFLDAHFFLMLIPFSDTSCGALTARLGFRAEQLFPGNRRLDVRSPNRKGLLPNGKEASANLHHGEAVSSSPLCA